MSALIESGKELTVYERASNALNKAETQEQLRALALESKAITTVTDSASREVCHKSMMTLKNMRLLVQKRAKKGREEAQEYSKTVISIEKELVALIELEETRLAGIRDEWDSIKEREKEAAIQAEIARVAQIQRFVDGIRQWPVLAAGKPSTLVDQMLQTATDYEITEEVFQERTEEAKTVLIASTAALQGIHTTAVAQEAEAERIRLGMLELAQMKAKAAEEERLAQVKRDEQVAADKIKHDAIVAEQAEANRVERERIAQEEAEARARRDAEAAKQAEIDAANRERNEMALQEIQAIHHQLIIADMGRAPYCKGNDLQSIDWTIDGTEKWELTEERFGALYAAAVKTKETTLVALRQKRVDFLARQETAAEAERQAAKANELATREEAIEAARKAAEPKPEPSKVGRTVARPHAIEIVQCVAEKWRVSNEMAAKWIRRAKVELDWAVA